jgi:hypothetical protein
MNQLSLLVKGVSQDLDFETGGMTNFVVLQLPDGRAFRASVDDAVAQVIIGAATNGVEVTEPKQTVQEMYKEQEPTMQAELERIKAKAEVQEDPMRHTLDNDGQVIAEFGGMTEEEMAYLSTGWSEVPKRTHEQVMRGRTVPSHLVDDMGNLSSVPGGGVDPGEVVAMDDEDGTDSI